MTVLVNVIMVAAVERGVYWMAGEPCKTASGARVYVTVRAWLMPFSSFSEKVVLKSCVTNGAIVIHTQRLKSDPG